MIRALKEFEIYPESRATNLGYEQDGKIGYLWKEATNGQGSSWNLYLVNTRATQDLEESE